MPFNLYQVYERVPLLGKAPDRLIITGEFACPDGHNSNVPVELRITSPPVAVQSWSGSTGGFPNTAPAGLVTCDLPAWSPHMCGQTILFEVRGLCNGAFTPWHVHEAVVGARSDNKRRTWQRKLDDHTHVPPDGYQPARRWYPATLEELLWCVQNHHEKAGPVAEARATASHWAVSYGSVTPGQMFETATPVHEDDGDQNVGRLNNVLYDVFPGCLTPDARGFFERRQQVHAHVDPKNPEAPPSDLQFYLFHVEAGTRIYELYSYIQYRSLKNLNSIAKAGRRLWALAMMLSLQQETRHFAFDDARVTALATLRQLFIGNVLQQSLEECRPLLTSGLLKLIDRLAELAQCHHKADAIRIDTGKQRRL